MKWFVVILSFELVILVVFKFVVWLLDEILWEMCRFVVCWSWNVEDWSFVWIILRGYVMRVLNELFKLLVMKCIMVECCFFVWFMIEIKWLRNRVGR